MKFINNKNNALVVIKPEFGRPIAMTVETNPETPGVAIFRTLDGEAICTTKIAMHVHLGNAFSSIIHSPLSEQRVESILKEEIPGSKEPFFRDLIKRAKAMWKSRTPSLQPELLKANQKKWRDLRRARNLELAKEACRTLIRSMKDSKERTYTGFEIASAVAKHFSNRRRAADRADGRGRYLKPILPLENLVEVFEEMGQPYQLDHFETLYRRGSREEDDARAKEARARRAEIREKLEKDQEAFVWNNNSEPAKHNG